MVFIRDQKENSDCHYEAHVWLDNHSRQCGCFAVKADAEKWAYWLQKRIVTGDLFRAIHKRVER